MAEKAFQIHKKLNKYFYNEQDFNFDGFVKSQKII